MKAVILKLLLVCWHEVLCVQEGMNCVSMVQVEDCLIVHKLAA